MAEHQSKIAELGTKIASLSEALSKCYLEAGSPEPSLEPSSVEVLETAEYSKLRATLNEAANELTLLVNGPKRALRVFGCSHFDMAAFQTALEFGFFETVPLAGSITLASLAEKVELNEDLVTRVIRLLATQHIFVEKQPGVVSHTSFSALIARDSDIKAAAYMQTDDVFKASASMADSCRKYDSFDSQKNAWIAQFGMPMFEYYKQHPAKAVRFARAMEGAGRWVRQFSELVEGFPWASLPEGSKVVDCGGGKGHASFTLTQEFPNLTCVVQDVSAQMMGDNTKSEERVTFMQHDFFEPQPIHDASVYFTRQVLHNWDDASVVKILRGYVPALEKNKPGTPLLINDIILPTPGTITRYEERILRQLDVGMLLQLGAKQRNVDDLRRLLKQADERYQIINIHDGAAMGVIEIHLVGSKKE